MVICAEIRVSATSPELVRVTCWAVLAVFSCWVAKVRLAGLRASVAGAVPVPLRAAVCVPAPSTTVSTPVRVPEAVGLKAIATVHPTPAASEVPQVFAVRRKSPPAEIVPSVLGRLPVFEMVMF